MRLALVGLLLALPGTALAENPWEELMGHKPRLWTEPSGRFSIDLPVGWSPGDPPAPNITTFDRRNDSGTQARVSVEQRVVPPKVKLAHFANTVMEEDKRAARQFTLTGHDMITVAGVKAERYAFSYEILGHTALVSEACQVVMVMGERAFIITLENPLGARGQFWEEFNVMLKGFNPEGGTPTEAAKVSGRRKLRAGEMVNPDGVQY